ncbi:PPK2 family polyphosphate kinase [uncultured Chitinophaga sp.]|jgi:polyphosphate:nucleotide phosphotransferase, PPK2 family|uniref:PPK2 family polyphosphate kinase n=1 Tax=uncultured Chitinophaga sp. TaxID=339340 RepID=UPI00262A714C|nr:PPK2 family polyphosphate kinase [uncultured Chitinophaga sp.]
MAKIKLSDIPTTPPKKLDKDTVKKATDQLLEELDELQNLLYAQHKNSVLVVLQGMDASGKDGAIRNVLGKLSPLGVRAQAFKAPTEEELDHDFLWRIHQHAPAKGMIQVFNRSHYEDVLIQRVHNWIDDDTAYKRMKAINDFERLLAAHNNTQILKFYLHISQEEQQQRLEERTEDPRKMWKYNEKDIEEARLWKQYRKAYEDVLEECSHIPWIIVPSDSNWYKEHIIAKTVRDTLKGLKMKYPMLKR